MDITLKIAGDDDKKEWDKIVENSPHATIFHTWKFLKIMEKHSGVNILWNDYTARLYPLIGFNGSAPIGLYPIFYYNSPLVKCVFSPPLRVGATYQGPLIPDYDNLSQSKRESYFFGLQKSVDEFMKSQLRANSIKIRLPPGLLDARPLLWNGYNVEPLYNYEIDLHKYSLEDVWSNIRKDCKRAIKKAEESGMVVLEGSRKEVELVFKSISERYSSQGITPEVSKEYLSEVYDTFYPDNLRILVVKKDDTYLTGTILLVYGKKVQAWIGMPRTTEKGVYPNDLLQWECLKWVHREGYKLFEITWANTYRLCRYKSKYDPILSPYFSCEKYSPFVSLLSFIKRIKK